MLVSVRMTRSFKLIYFYRRQRSVRARFTRQNLHEGVFIDNQLVVGKEQEHVSERYPAFLLLSDDRFVVQAAEQSAASAYFFIVNP